MQKAPKIILGIDPGTLVMGYGLIAVKGNAISLLDLGVLKLSSKTDPYRRLETIHKTVVALIGKHHPSQFAIEAPFFGKNVQSMLKLGRAQGVAIAAAMQAGLEVCEYSPKKVKQSVTGNGNAGKEQVMKMLQHLLSFTSDTKNFDATDALAVAVCHHFQGQKTMPNDIEKVNGWKAFLSNNPGRIKNITR